MAVLAMKVMVVSLVRTLVAWCLSRDLNATDKTLILEGFQGTVDSGNAQGGDGFQRQSMDLVRQEGADFSGENCLDGFFLFCGASLE